MYILLCYLVIGIVFASVMYFMDTKIHDDNKELFDMSRNYRGYNFVWLMIILSVLEFCFIVLIWPIGLGSRLIEHSGGNKF